MATILKNYSRTKLDIGFPTFVIKILAFWYTDQDTQVRWGITTTSSFLVSNGAKQGDTLSPMLFNVYMDKLIIKLNRSGIRGDIGCHLFNHLCYADDLSSISLSSAGMQKLLDMCSSYAIEHNPIMEVNHTRYISNLSILNFMHHVYI